MSKILQKHSFSIGLLITLSLLWPLLAGPFFTHHDDVQTIRLYEMNKCIRDGQIPCRWVPDLGGLYGYPIFNYYAPLPYYYGEIFYLLTGSLVISVKIMFATALVGSYLGMYLLGRKIWGNLGGSLAAIFYSLAPYHAVVLYVRGAMGENWGLLFFPLILWSLLKLRDEVKVTGVISLSFFLALLIISHNLSMMMFLPVIFLFTLFILWDLRKTAKFFRFFKFFIFSIILAVLLSSFYLWPMLLEKDFVHLETTTSGYFSYTEHFKGLKKLFIERTWGWGGSVREVPGGEKDGMSFQIGWAHTLVIILSLIAFKKFWKSDRQKAVLILLSLSGFVGAIFLINPKSQLIWDLLQPMKYFQFPWRFLQLIIFFASLLAGSTIYLVREKYRQFWWIGLVFLCLALNFYYFRPERFINISDQQILSGENWDKVIKRSIYDFLPKSAKEPPRDLATVRYEVIVGEAVVSDFFENSYLINFNVLAKTHTILRISQYYFPGWRVSIDGQKVETAYSSNHLGLMDIILGPGQHRVEAVFQNTQIRSVANLLTVLGGILFILLVLTQIPKSRKIILYYLESLHR